MVIYIARNVVKGDFSMNNAPLLVPLCRKQYDITDLFDISEHVDYTENENHELLKEDEFHKFRNIV